jgi:hypothetical protein
MQRLFMDIFFIVFVSLLISVIVILLVRLLRMDDASAVEPVTQRDYEAQYQSLKEDIQVLEDRVQHGAATRKMKVELANLHQQAEDLFTLLTPSLINGVPQDYQPDIDSESPFIPTYDQTAHNDLQICSNCGSKVLVGDKFCANCGNQLQQRFQA